MPQPSRGLQGLAVSAGCTSPAAGGFMEISIIPSRSGCRDKGAPLPARLRREPPRQLLCQGHWFRQTEILPEKAFCAYGCGDEWKFMGLFILIKSRGHLRRNRLSEKGTSKGKCVVRKFMDFGICKAEVCSLFTFVLLLMLFMGHFKNPQELSQIWNNICTNYSTAFELMGYGTASGVKGPPPRLAYSNPAPSHTALRANKLFIQWTQLVQVNSNVRTGLVKWGYLRAREKKTSRS